MSDIIAWLLDPHAVISAPGWLIALTVAGVWAAEIYKVWQYRRLIREQRKFNGEAPF